MKHILILTMFANFFLPPAMHAQGYRLNQSFNAAVLTPDQMESIENAFEKLKNVETPHKDINIKINLHAYRLMSAEQRTLYDNSWKELLRQRYQSIYGYLQITDDQVNRMLEMQEIDSMSDSLKIVKANHTTPKDSLLQMLDSIQLSLEADYQKGLLVKRRASTAYVDDQRIEQAAFEKLRSSLAKAYHKRFLVKVKRRVLDQIRRVSAADANKAEDLCELYQTRVAFDKHFEISLCYSEDSILNAPNTRSMLEYKYERLAYLPDLCVYWCRFGPSDTPEARAEEEEVLRMLEYFKSSYSVILNTALDQLRRPREKLSAKVAAARPKRKGTTVNIVATERTQAVEGIAEILLAR